MASKGEAQPLERRRAQASDRGMEPVMVRLRRRGSRTPSPKKRRTERTFDPPGVPFEESLKLLLLGLLFLLGAFLLGFFCHSVLLIKKSHEKKPNNDTHVHTPPGSRSQG